MPERRRVVVKELILERLLLREPNKGRVRAILETGPPRDPVTGAPVPAVRFRLLSPDGRDALVLEVGDDGEAWVFVGNPDSGPTVAIHQAAVDIWSQGNIVAALVAGPAGGRVELLDDQGDSRVLRPRRSGPS